MTCRASSSGLDAPGGDAGVCAPTTTATQTASDKSGPRKLRPREVRVGDDLADRHGQARRVAEVSLHRLEVRRARGANERRRRWIALPIAQMLHLEPEL